MRIQCCMRQTIRCPMTRIVFQIITLRMFRRFQATIIDRRPHRQHSLAQSLLWTMDKPLRTHTVLLLRWAWEVRFLVIHIFRQQTLGHKRQQVFTTILVTDTTKRIVMEMVTRIQADHRRDRTDQLLRVAMEAAATIKVLNITSLKNQLRPTSIQMITIRMHVSFFFFLCYIDNTTVINYNLGSPKLLLTSPKNRTTLQYTRILFYIIRFQRSLAFDLTFILLMFEFSISL